MKRSPLVLLVIALIAVATFTVMPTQQPAAAAENGEELHEAMETMGKTYRLVRRQMSDESKNADTADKLATMIDAAHISKQHLPGTASTDDLKKKYRVTMNKLIIELALAENAALEGDQAKLREHILAANQVKGEGHELFIADDE
jgi:soluble cytochrome b562